MSALCVWSIVEVRLDLYSRLTNPAGLLVRPFPDATVEVPGATLDAISSKLCSSLVLVRTIRRTLFASDARPWLNSSTPLLANLTTFELCAVCKGAIVEVSGRCILMQPLFRLTNAESVSVCALVAAHHPQQSDGLREDDDGHSRQAQSHHP
jgi:hypothetical protein